MKQKNIMKKLVSVILALALALTANFALGSEAYATTEPVCPGSEWVLGPTESKVEVEGEVIMYYVWGKYSTTITFYTIDGVAYDCDIFEQNIFTPDGADASDMWTPFYPEYGIGTEYNGKSSVMSLLDWDLEEAKTTWKTIWHTFKEAEIESIIQNGTSGLDPIPDGSTIINLRKHVAASTPSSASLACNHSFERRVIKEATAQEDGVEADVCIKCGAIKNESPLSSFGAACYEADKKVKAAGAGTKLELELGEWNSLPRYVMESIAARSDVTFEIRFKYEHKSYKVIIPAGTKIVLEDGIPFYGPLKLNQMFGMQEI